MAMTRMERVMSHIKGIRTTGKIGKNRPLKTEMKEGVPMLRYIPGQGVIEFIKMNNQIHEKPTKNQIDNISKRLDSLEE
tara:strand:- start:237 stop:473 length:237 start_codon:yes stop_codon:yes gene_type:complete